MDVPEDGTVQQIPAVERAAKVVLDLPGEEAGYTFRTTGGHLSMVGSHGPKTSLEVLRSMVTVVSWEATEIISQAVRCFSIECSSGRS